MTTATKKAPARKPVEKRSVDYLQQALEDLALARGQAQHEVRRSIDAAAERIREARKELLDRAHEQADDLQGRLDQASEDALREFGRAAVRAQRTPEALTEMQTEIRARKRTLLV